MLECDLRLYQQSHSHSDEEYLSLLRLRQLLQKVSSQIVLLHTFRFHIMYDSVCVYYHHAKERLHSEIRNWEMKCVYILVVFRTQMHLNTELDLNLVPDLHWQKNEATFQRQHFFFFFSMCVSLCMCVCVSVSALYWAGWAPCRVWKGYSSD